jgi:hypothetical protein
VLPSSKVSKCGKNEQHNIQLNSSEKQLEDLHFMQHSCCSTHSSCFFSAALRTERASASFPCTQYTLRTTPLMQCTAVLTALCILYNLLVALCALVSLLCALLLCCSIASLKTAASVRCVRLQRLLAICRYENKQDYKKVAFD